MTKTAAIYARFSSDHQNDRSITDQFSLCKTYAKREGFKISDEFSDSAKTGATLFDRDGLLELMAAAKAKKFDAVIVESLDRMSRDTADLAGLHKRLKFYGVELRAVNEGIVTDIHVGIRGIVGSLFLKDLGDKVRRHHLGRVAEGHVMGRLTYGYNLTGKAGERAIDPEKAAVVRRIFKEYGDGVSPREIAEGLTRDRIPAPNGAGAWSHQTFLGGGGKNGMIDNRLYIGELVYNRHHSVRDPEANRVLQRANPKTDHVMTPVPHLRIVSQELWDAAHRTREGRGLKKFGPNGLKLRAGGAVRRGDHPLAGLLRCGTCGGNMIFTTVSRGTRFVTCSAARTKSACSHRKAYDVDRILKNGVIENLRSALIDPQRAVMGAKAAAAEYEALQKKNRTERIDAQKRINALTVTINRLVDAIENSDQAVKPLTDKLVANYAEREGLQERVRLLEANDKVVALPNMIDDYTKAVEKLVAGLSQEVIGPEFVIGLRNIMDSIVVIPTGYRKAYVIDMYGRHSARMGGVEMFPTMRSAQEILSEEGVSSASISSNSGGQVQRSHTVGQVRIGLGPVLFLPHVAP